MPRPRYWILLTGPHITETYIWPDGGDVWSYDASPNQMVRKDDILYFWLTYQNHFYGWGEVIETPQIVNVEGPTRAPDGELATRRRQRIKVHRKKGFTPPITQDAMLRDPNLKRLVPAGFDDLYAVPLTTVQANYINDFARRYGLDSPEGSEAVDFKFEETMPQFILKAVIELGDKTADGQIVEAVLIPWYDIIDTLIRDPEEAYKIPHRKWEEIVAGAYWAADFDNVILTPRSADYGRDIIAEKKGLGTIRIVDQVKAYKPGHLVNADDVRSLAGVLAMEGVSKAFLTTTSDFAPRIRQDPFIESWIPSKLELVDGHKLIKRLIELRAKKPHGELIIKPPTR